ncbi:peroxidase 44-like [Primulina eburnea]|uniref:peroxidase 44-like n=1 Tax=Primulina eburnea TaxID=1245227 RepID=UPI003C6C3F0A
MAARMAARGRIIVAATFISCALVLPLLASAFEPSESGLRFPLLDFINSPFKNIEGVHETEDPPKDDEDGSQSSEVPENEMSYERPSKGEEEESVEKAKIEQTEEGNGIVGQPEAKPVENEGQGRGGEAKPGEGNGEAAAPVGNAKEGLMEGFYEKDCPQAEQIVNEVLMKNLKKDATLAPAIVRLFSHDCLVKGCDASILLDETPSGEDVEKKATQNGKFVRGFDMIDEMKERLEAECPGIVSCADIIAFANRDSLVYTGLPTYKVAAGRRDGLSSLAVNAKNNLPVPDTPIQEMIDMFKRKGLTLEDLVVLVGAHSIGTAHCGVVRGRLFDRNKSKEMNPNYAEQMRFMCERDDNTLPFDSVTHNKMDAQIYNQFLDKRALLESDNALAKDPHGNDIMKKMASDQAAWFQKFIRATVKMGEIEVLTGNQGEIRKQCRVVN